MILKYHKIIESYQNIFEMSFVICYKIIQSVFSHGQLYIVVSKSCIEKRFEDFSS
jgi:hypothetical protein